MAKVSAWGRKKAMLILYIQSTEKTEKSNSSLQPVNFSQRE